MPIINPPVGGQARSIHVQQIINWLRGLPSYSEAVNFTGISSSSNWALTTANGGTGGKAFRARNSNQTITLFEVQESGVVVRPNASDSVAFRVRNFLDNADLFTVNADGTVSIGSSTPVTLTGTQTLTNKTLTSPILNSPTINSAVETSPNVANYLEFDWNTNPGGAVNKSRVWAKNDNGIYYTLPGGTIVSFITSLNAPSLSALGFARNLALSGG